MSPSLKLLCILGLTSLLSCAVAGEHDSIHYRIVAEPVARTVEIACASTSPAGCVFWIGEPKSSSHRSVHLDAGATERLGSEVFDAHYCAAVREDRLEWPGCLDRAPSGELSQSTNVDYVFW